mmetsp:Transcript_36910/g.77933  ORF Transcript_36910/g.77933 Transcript_36910/m.77933 type:complete len:88 (-) Transcript_36910:103-366(-)
MDDGDLGGDGSDGCIMMKCDGVDYYLSVMVQDGLWNSVILVYARSNAVEQLTRVIMSIKKLEALCGRLNCMKAEAAKKKLSIIEKTA